MLILLYFFFDDGWLIDSDRDACAVLATNIWSDLRKSGFFTNDEKSQWCQSQVLEWLGTIWNTINGTIASYYNKKVGKFFSRFWTQVLAG